MNPVLSRSFEQPPAFVDQLLSLESLKKTGYFLPEEVQKFRGNYRTFGWFGGQRLSLEMGLTAVMATQLWHHLYLGGGLCELPEWSPPETSVPTPTAVSATRPTPPPTSRSWTRWKGT